MSATSTDRLRIGEVAELTGTTPRTIRYYEEIGLLAGAPDRVQGQHRLLHPGRRRADQRDRPARDLLGLSLEQLSQMLEAEAARAEIKREYHRTEDPDLRRQLLQRSLHHIANQLELVRGRRAELEKLESELVDKRRLVQKRLKELRLTMHSVDRRAMATLSAGHLFTDIAQGSIPALLPFLIAHDHLNYAAASALVLAATISSCVIQPLFGSLLRPALAAVADAARAGARRPRGRARRVARRRTR